MSTYKVIKEFEKEMATYSGSKYAVAIDNCTNALFLCCRYLKVKEVTIPARTYVSVPCSIINAGGAVAFKDSEWTDRYWLEPYNIVDSALCFYRNMYIPDSYYCVSFSDSKPINIGKGGMILTDDKESVEWFKIARYMGRHEVSHETDEYSMVGWNMYMTPSQAARGLVLLSKAKDKYIINKPNFQDLSKYQMYIKANR